MGGLAAGCAAAVGVAFLAGCAFAITIGHGTHVDPSSGKKVLDVLPLGAVLGVGMFTAFVAAPIAIVVTIVVGAPLFSLYTRRGYRSLMAYIGAGVLMSVAVGAPVAAANYFWGWLEGAFLLAMPAIGIAGPVAALVIWKILQPQSPPG